MITEIYVDESSQTQCRFLLLGAVCIGAEKVSAAEAKISEVRRGRLPHGEMKWGKVSRNKFDVYRDVVDAFFDDHAFKDAQFHSVVVDTTKLDHATYNAGSSEIGFNKEIYQLASKCAQAFSKNLLHLYPDYRDTSHRPSDLRNILNMGRRKVGDQRDWPFRRCQFRDSKTAPLLSFPDLFIGAIAYKLNGHDKRPGASPAKISMADYVLAKAGVQNPFSDTKRFGKFTIWHRQLRQPKHP